MSAPNKRQLAIHSDKWVVTVREAKDLTRGQQRDSFFTKMSPVCELSLGDQGPFSTSVKPNTTQPSWDESLEFEAYPSPPVALSTVPSSSPSRSSAAVEGKIGEEGEEDDGAGGLPPAGPKLGVVCYTRGVNATGAGAGAEGGGAEGGAGRGQRGRSVREKVEIGRAEVTLSVEGTEVLKKVRVTLHRRNAVGSQIPAGSVGVEYMLVPGIPPLPDTPPAEEQRLPPAAVVSGADVPAFVVERPRPSALEPYSDNRGRKGLGRKPVLFLAAVAVAAIAALLATRLASLDDLGLALGLSAPMPPLSPIPVPFKFAAGKYKGSITHHIRLQAEDGNIVVATGPKPPPPLPPPPTNTGGKPAATATLLWQSGPIRSLERSEDPSKRTCKKCQLRVGRDGRVVVARGKEELAVFSPSSVRKLKAFLLLGDGN